MCIILSKLKVYSSGSQPLQHTTSLVQAESVFIFPTIAIFATQPQCKILIIVVN